MSHFLRLFFYVIVITYANEFSLHFRRQCADIQSSDIRELSTQLTLKQSAKSASTSDRETVLRAKEKELREYHEQLRRISRQYADDVQSPIDDETTTTCTVASFVRPRKAAPPAEVNDDGDDEEEEEDEEDEDYEEAQSEQENAEQSELLESQSE